MCNYHWSDSKPEIEVNSYSNGYKELTFSK